MILSELFVEHGLPVVDRINACSTAYIEDNKRRKIELPFHLPL